MSYAQITQKKKEEREAKEAELATLRSAVSPDNLARRAEQLQKLEELKECSDELPLPYAALERMADEAIVALATDLEERYGICA